MASYLLDENVNEHGKIAARCQEWGIAVYRVWDFGLEETEDFLIFQFALDHNHVIVTGNIFEFRQFQKELAAKGKITPGAIYVPGRYHKNTTLIVQRILEVEIDEYYAGGEWWVGS